MITTFIFDLDGLLIDSEIVYFHVVEALMEKYGKKITLRDYVQDNSGRVLMENAEIYARKYDLPLSAREVADYITQKEGEYRRNPGIPLKKGAAHLLQYLKEHGHHVSLATSSTEDRAVYILEKNHVMQYFDDETYGSEVKRGKPDPEVFLTAAGKAGADPSECLVLEDSENGIKAAKSAGMRVICVPDMKKPSSNYIEMADAVVTDLDDVITLLENGSLK